MFLNAKNIIIRKNDILYQDKQIHRDKNTHLSGKITFLTSWTLMLLKQVKVIL